MNNKEYLDIRQFESDLKPIIEDKEIANERFPLMMSHIKRKQYIKTEEYISMLPDCLKAKIIPILVLDTLK